MVHKLYVYNLLCENLILTTFYKVKILFSIELRVVYNFKINLKCCKFGFADK